MRKLIMLLVFLPLLSWAQESNLTIVVKENPTNVPVYGAKVVVSDKIKALTNDLGVANFSKVPYGKYNVVITMATFDTLFVDLVVNKPEIKLNLSLGGSLELEEMKVIGNLVTDRKTPVAVTKIDPQKITEELGSRDIPMLLNSTPGVYATNTGGGDGDARITVRGFDQRNVGVMIDGVPVNDMENGAVYWSNWFGLDAITSNIQMQRGLGATKLAMPSIGGTLNILTAGIGSRKGLTFKQEFASGMFFRSTLSYNTGMMKNGFGFTFSGSYKQGNGWVDGTPTQGAFYYAKVQKKIKKHLISFSAFGAPQQHGQRSFNQPIQYFSESTAEDLGLTINPNQPLDRGVRYNEHWGYRTVDGKREVFNERRNYYHKPQITLKDFWQVNKKLSISNLAYVSIGRGGGERALDYGNLARDTQTNQIDWDQVIENNKYTTFFGQTVPNVDPFYHPTEIRSNQIITASINNHFWIGYLGQFNYEMSKFWNFSGGVDYRYYKGSHYREIKDLLGGDYYINEADKNSASPIKRVGDKIALLSREADRDGLVQWAGVFGQAEYTGSRWTTFLNLSGVYNGYNGIDYFQKKTLEVGDTTLRIGYGETVNYNGQSYTQESEGVKDYQTGWKWVPGYTVKTGASYTLNEESVVFLNLGYLNRTPIFSNVVDNNYNRFFANILNEKISAVEGGYSFANKFFGINVNGYFTYWQNKPFPFGVAIPDPNDPQSQIRVNLQGMDAIHIGGEVDLAWKINKKLSADVMISIGDWRWNSAQTIFIEELDNFEFSFDAKGVHVGDAAQSVYSASLRYEPIKKLFFKAQYMYFDRYYAQFNPFTLSGPNARKDAWRIPGYGLMNIFAGYKYNLKKYELIFNAGVTNALNTVHIADATDNFYAPFNFSAQSASVMFGQGLRFNVSAAIQF